MVAKATGSRDEKLGFEVKILGLPTGTEAWRELQTLESGGAKGDPKGYWEIMLNWARTGEKITKERFFLGKKFVQAKERQLKTEAKISEPDTWELQKGLELFVRLKNDITSLQKVESELQKSVRETRLQNERLGLESAICEAGMTSPMPWPSGGRVPLLSEVLSLREQCARRGHALLHLKLENKKALEAIKKSIK